MIRLRRSPVLALSLCLLGILLSFQPAAPVSARARPQDGFAVQVRGADPELRKRTQEIITAAHDDLKKLSGIGFTDTVDVIYVLKGQTFDSIAGGHFPDWGVGVAIAARNLIALRSPRDYPIHDQLRSILRHELAHLHLELLLGGHRPPRWVHEGYAQQFAHEWNYGDDWKVARAVFTHSTIPLAEIDGVNSFQGAQAELAYIQSYLAMGYFLTTYGWDGLMLMARAMRNGDDWDVAFQASTGADYASFQSEFAEYLRERFNWAAFLGDTIIFWILLAVLFVVFYFIKRHRAASKLADWKQQESLEDILYAPFNQPPEQDPDQTENGPRP